MTIIFIVTGVVGLALILVYLVNHKQDSGDPTKPADMGVLAAQYHTKRNIANQEHTVSFIDRKEALNRLEKMPERLEREEQREKATHKNVLIVIEEADKQKESPSTYEALKLAEGTAQIAILQAQALSDIEWERYEKEHRLQIEGAILLFLKEHGAMKGLRTMFNDLVRERDAIANGNDSPQVIERLLVRYDKDIDFLNGVMDAKANRLLQENNREES